MRFSVHTGIASVRPTVWMVRGIGASLCSEAAGHDATRWLSRGIRATRNLALELFFVGTGALRGCTALQELRHMPRLAGFAGRARGRIAADLGLQLDDVDACRSVENDPNRSFEAFHA